MLPRLLLLLTMASAARAEFLRIEIFMKDMECLSCSDSLGKAFERMRGVKHVDVRVKEGSVALELVEQNRITMEQVWDAVKRVGFTPADSQVVVRGTVKGASLVVSVIDKTLIIDGFAAEGENVELKGIISPPPDPRTPVRLKISN